MNVERQRLTPAEFRAQLERGQRRGTGRRATDYQKDAAASLLNQAYALGQLTQEELSERLDAAYTTPVEVSALEELLEDVATGRL